MTRDTRQTTSDMSRVARYWVRSSCGQLHGWVPHGQILLLCPMLGYVRMWAASWLSPLQGSYMAESHMGRYFYFAHCWDMSTCGQLHGWVPYRAATWLSPTWAGTIIHSYNHNHQNILNPPQIHFLGYNLDHQAHHIAQAQATLARHTALTFHIAQWFHVKVIYNWKQFTIRTTVDWRAS